MADPVSIIGTILQLLDTAKKCYDKVQGARKLRHAFHEIYSQIDLVKATFEEIKGRYRDDDDRRNIADVLKQCEQDTRSLMEIYVLVSENAEKPWATRYADYIKSMAKDRKGKVEELWARILEGIHVLQGFHVFSSLATRDQIEEALLKIEAVENSLSDNSAGGDSYYAPVASTHSGSGVNNSQNQLNTGSGVQFMGGTHNHAALDTSGGRLKFTGIYSNIARSPVKTYVERPELQTQMKEALHDTVGQRNNSSAKILVVCGLGGAGKSQLTLNYIDRYQDDYTTVFWIDAGTKALLEADYKQIRNSFYSAKRTDMDLKACVFEVRQWCRQMEGRWLFVYDSADEIDGSQNSTHINLREVIVNTPNLDIIITTRSQSAKDMTDLEAVQVGDMTLVEARELFVRRSKLSITSDDVQKQVDNIVRELAHFALAINLAGAYVAETPRLRKDLGEYLSEYRLRRKAVLKREPKAHVDQYGASVLTTWETSYDAISARLPEAGKLLSFLAFLGPEDLFPELFEAKDKSALEIHASWLSVDSTTTSIQEVLDSSFTMLGGYSLVLWRDEQDSYSMHKLVHDWSYERLDDESQAAFCNTALDFLVYTGRERISEPDFKARLVSHAIACFERTRECYKSNHASRAIVLRELPDLARFLTAVGGYRLACDVWFFLHECCLQDDCADPALYFTAVQSMVANMDVQARRAEGRDILQPALDQARALYGSENSLTCNLVWSLGKILFAERKFLEAGRLMESAVNGLGGLGSLNAMTDLTRVFMYQGDFVEAERLSRQAFIGLEAICGRMDQSTLTAMRDLGLILACSGKHSEADAVLRQALHCCQVTLGMQHTHTLICALFCGFVAMNLKKCDEGMGLVKQVLADAAAVGVAEHNAVLSHIPLLGRTAKDQRAYNEALNLYRMAYEAYAAALGPRTSVTLECMADCGSLAIRLHRYEEGERLLRQAMSETDMVEGMHHERALWCVFELGNAARKQGSYDKALDLYKKAYDGYFATLGVGDENTLTCHENLSQLRQLIQSRTDLLHSSEKASTRFAELLQAKRHLQTPSQGRGRAYTDPGPGKAVEWYLGTAYEEWSDTRSSC